MLGWLRVVGSRIWGWLSQRAADEEFARELDSHLEMLAQENVRRGMAPEEARRAARWEFLGASGLLTVVALFACFVPARRASRLDLL